MYPLTPQPSAIPLTAGLTLSVIGGVVAVFGGAMLWVGLIIGVIGACQTILGVYRLATAIDLLAARTARKPAPERTTA
jgi:hypothetical protein